jgi:hypothetical protein
MAVVNIAASGGSVVSHIARYSFQVTYTGSSTPSSSSNYPSGWSQNAIAGNNVTVNVPSGFFTTARIIGLYVNGVNSTTNQIVTKFGGTVMYITMPTSSGVPGTTFTVNALTTTNTGVSNNDTIWVDIICAV